MARHQSVLRHRIATLLILALVWQGLPWSLVLSANEQEQTSVSPRQEAARWRSLADIPRITTLLDTRQKILVAIYLTAPERERVAIAADYLADQHRRNWTTTQRTY